MKDVFMYISLKTEQIWTKLGRRMGSGERWKERSFKIFGEIALGAPEKGAAYHYFS